IMNEPQNNGNYSGKYAWKAESSEAVAHTNSVYDRMIKAIRQVDANHPITVEGIWTVDVLPDPNEYGWTNMIYQLHIYDTTVDMIDKRVTELITAKEKYGVAALVGEYNSKALERYATEKYLSNDISRIKWTYKTFNVPYDNWGLFNKQYNKINLRTASYDEIKSAFDNDISTDKNFLLNVTEYNMIKSK
ncbi:MAG: cellulase family glycosylhydrolase, partial [Monoglobaceae bacterium]